LNEVTQLLQAMAEGDALAGERLIPLIYDELRRMAAQRFSRNSANQTLQPTALVHKVWLRLGGSDMPGWQNRAHFFATAATAMRSIMVDRARRRNAQRRGGGQERVNLDEVEIADGNQRDDQVLAVHEALDRLAIEDPRKAELVKLRYFAGLTGQEAAEALGISARAADRTWLYARTWLLNKLESR